MEKEGKEGKGERRRGGEKLPQLVHFLNDHNIQIWKGQSRRCLEIHTFKICVNFLAFVAANMKALKCWELRKMKGYNDEQYCHKPMLCESDLC